MDHWSQGCGCGIRGWIFPRTMTPLPKIGPDLHLFYDGPPRSEPEVGVSARIPDRRGREANS